jgi:hypothetical protein
MSESKKNLLLGLPRGIWDYYCKFPKPAEAVSVRYIEKSGNQFWSIQFKDHPYRHRWIDNPIRKTKYGKYRTPDGWVLEILPLGSTTPISNEPASATDTA